jgi:hypothetical protein
MLLNISYKNKTLHFVDHFLSKMTFLLGTIYPYLDEELGSLER